MGTNCPSRVSWFLELPVNMPLVYKSAIPSLCSKPVYLTYIQSQCFLHTCLSMVLEAQTTLYSQSFPNFSHWVGKLYYPWQKSKLKGYRGSAGQEGKKNVLDSVLSIWQGFLDPSPVFIPSISSSTKCCRGLCLPEALVGDHFSSFSLWHCKKLLWATTFTPKNLTAWVTEIGAKLHKVLSKLMMLRWATFVAVIVVVRGFQAAGWIYLQT